MGSSVTSICFLIFERPAEGMFWFVLNIFSYIIRKFTKKQRPPAITDGGDTPDYGGAGRLVFPVGPGWRSPGKRLRISPKKGSRDQPPETYFTERMPGNDRTRRESFVEVEGSGKSVAVLTSGGDAQGRRQLKLISNNMKNCI